MDWKLQMAGGGLSVHVGVCPLPILISVPTCLSFSGVFPMTYRLRSTALKLPAALSSGVLSVILSNVGLAADYLPMGDMDAKADGSVSTAQSAAELGRGGITPKVSLWKLQQESHATRASAMFGVGLGSRLDLSLGLHGVGEDKADEFSGATVFVKVKLADFGWTKLAIAPFFQTGSGQDAIDSKIRSVGSKAGGLAALTFGDTRSVALNLNAGMRYHDNEFRGGELMREESFYQSQLATTIGYRWTFAIDGKARRVTSAQAVENAEELASYKSKWSYGSGAAVTFSDFGRHITLQYAKGVRGAEEFGYGDRSVNISFAMDLGRSARDGRSSYADGISGRAPAPEQQKDVLVLEDGAPQFLKGGDVTPAKDAGDGQGDDFAQIDQRAAKIKQDFSQESEDDRIERELKALKAAEEKLAKEEAAIQAAEDEALRIQAVKKAEKDDAANREAMKKAEEEAVGLPGATTDELNWNGLED